MNAQIIVVVIFGLAAGLWHLSTVLWPITSVLSARAERTILSIRSFFSKRMSVTSESLTSSRYNFTANAHSVRFAHAKVYILIAFFCDTIRLKIFKESVKLHFFKRVREAPPLFQNQAKFYFPLIYPHFFILHYKLWHCL